VRKKEPPIRIEPNEMWFCPKERAFLKLQYFENELQELEQELNKTNIKNDLLKLVSNAHETTRIAMLEFKEVASA